MRPVLSKLCIGVSLVLLAAIVTLAQNAENASGSIGKADQSESPRGMKDQLVKMQIDREKKNFQEMLDRGEEAAKLSDQVEKSLESRGALNEEDKQKIENVEKLVKKIRSELGGSEGDETDEDLKKEDNPTDVVSGVKYLRDSTAQLLDELKKTSRFTISAMAIQNSNAVLKIVRFLRFEK